MENYRGVIKEGLAPFCGEREASRNKAKSYDHVPSPNMRNRVGGITDVVSHDPSKANQKGGDHERSEPRWALFRQRSCMGYLVWDVDGLFLTATGLRHR